MKGKYYTPEAYGLGKEYDIHNNTSHERSMLNRKKIAKNSKVMDSKKVVEKQNEIESKRAKRAINKRINENKNIEK